MTDCRITDYDPAWSVQSQGLIRCGTAPSIRFTAITQLAEKHGREIVVRARARTEKFLRGKTMHQETVERSDPMTLTDILAATSCGQMAT